VSVLGAFHSVAERPLFGQAELRRLIDPRSVAVIGASSKAGSFGARTLENIGKGYTGKVYPVNPRYELLADWRCYRSLDELPEAPDCVIVAVPRERVLHELERAAALGVGGAIVYSSGFAEVGTPERIEDQRRIADLARRSRMRVLGPNCAGIANLVSGVGLTFMPKFYEMPMIQGPIGLVSQSGGLGYVVLQALQRGIGFSHYLSAGNSCDVDVCDFVNYLVDEETTRVVICMLEGVRDGHRLIAAAERALRADKPLLVYKLGNSEIARGSAMSHTGTLIGGSAAYRAAFQRTGAVVIDDWEQLLETANFFAKAGTPKARGVGVMSSSGGVAVMAADKAEELEIELPPPAAETTARLSSVIPDFGSNTNPSDITAESVRRNDMYGECIRAFADDPNFSVVVVPMMSAHSPVGPERAEYLCSLSPTFAKPVCVVWLNEWLEGPGSRIYDGCTHIATFRSMTRCLKAVKLWLDHYQRRDELLRPNALGLADRGAAEAARMKLAAAGGRVLSERRSKELLAAYGIPVGKEFLATNAEAAMVAAKMMGFPVVMKADSPDIPHKTEAGVVKLGIGNVDGVRRAYAEIADAAAHVPAARLNGVLVQEMVLGGTEMMVGGRIDAQFGPLVTCGFGGIAVELNADVASALAPVDMARARAMIASLRGYPLLTGFRLLPPLDIEAFAQVVCRVSELVADLADAVAEIDVNPVILGRNWVVAVDALVVCSERPVGQ
jgi:acyl-CoA synthetase (NDP forming)